MMPGRMPGGSGDMDLNSVFEAVGAYKAGKMDDAQLRRGRILRVPRLRQLFRHVHRQLHELSHARSWAWRCRATARLPAVDAARIRLAKQTGMRIVELVERRS